MRQLRFPANSRTGLSSKRRLVLDCNYLVVSHGFCRKKFAKLKVKFELGMRESEALIREELRIQDLSKRIQEQNE